MCGIAGFLDPSGVRQETAKKIAEKMILALRHRGPDSNGTWLDAAAGVVFGHSRLSIQDLSPSGHQPMLSNSGRYVLTFNGEIYNFLELKKDLGDYPFAGNSDTEVILALCERHGIQGLVEHLVGMFAMAIWDRRERRLHLFRDRAGEKPLYYGRAGKTFLFASEIKALRAHPDFAGNVSPGALTKYFRFGYIPAPLSIYEDIYKLEPAGHLRLDESGRIENRRYWRIPERAEAGQAAGDDEERVSHLHDLLLRTVRRQMIADVPLGAFFSGGIDSSLTVALMQSISSRPIKTFTVGFQEKEFNEAPFAKRISERLGTDHTELFVQPRDSLDIIPTMSAAYDEPFSDPSAIPTMLISKLTRSMVTVALSGDAGDELFAGYDRYFRADRLWRSLRFFPSSLRKIIGSVLLRIPERSRLPGLSANKLTKLGRLLENHNLQSLYCNVSSHWSQPENLVLNGNESGCFNEWSEQKGLRPIERFMLADFHQYMPDDILVKVDRAAMHYSLETRVPLLDHQVVEYACQLPFSMKVRENQTKWALRKILYQYVPPELIERPKMGFGVPIAHWIRNELRDWAEDLLDEAQIRDEGLIDPQPVRRLWQEHLAGRFDWSYLLWDVIAFRSWHRQQAML